MKRGIVIFGVFLFLSFSISGILVLPSASADEVVIEMADLAYDPAEVTITAGTTVTWVNKDFEPHTVTADDNSFDSETILPDKSFSHRFDKTGEYPYHCLFHLPEMVGKVIVK